MNSKLLITIGIICFSSALTQTGFAATKPTPRYDKIVACSQQADVNDQTKKSTNPNNNNLSKREKLKERRAFVDNCLRGP